MNYKDLILEIEDGIATLTLNRPEKLNAFSMAMMEGLPRAVEEVRQNDDVRAVIVTGAGRAFCAGMDLEVLELYTTTGGKPRRELLEPMGFFNYSLQRLEKPTIAAVNGIAVGGGLSVALACDMRIASEKARFGSIFVRRGLIPDMGSTYYLPRVVGISRALELMLTGDIIDAREAERIGLVNRVVAHQDLMNATRELATKIAQGPPITIELTKRAAYSGIVSDLESQYIFESYAQRICLGTEDHQEGLKSFFEKREPTFRGK